MASMNCFDSDRSNGTNTVVFFDGKDGNLYLRLRAMSHKMYAAKFEQTITHVLLRVLIAHRIFINFGYVDYFQWI